MRLTILAVAGVMALSGCNVTVAPTADEAKTEQTAQEPVATTPVASTEPVKSEVPGVPSEASENKTEYPNVLTYQGFNDVRLGMSKKDLLAAYKGNIRQIEDIMDGTPDGCHYIRLKGAGEPLVMLEKDKVMRIEGDAKMENFLGVKVGQSMADVKKQFTHAKITKHHYVPGAEELTIWNPDKTAAFLVEGDAKGFVQSVRVGKSPNIHYSEGCA